MDSRQCTGCGAELPEGGSFCAACGAPVKAEASAATIPSGYCSACGAVLPAGASFCGSCGVRVRAETTAPGRAPVGAAPGGGDSEWPMWRHDPGRTGGDGSAVFPPLIPLWEFPADDSIVDSLAVAGGVVCFADKSRNVYALDASTGKPRWVRILDRAATSAPIIAAGLAFLCCEDGNLYALDLDSGQERWRYSAQTTAGAPPVSPTFGDGKIFLCDLGETLHCLEAVNGQRLWLTELKGSWTSMVRRPPVYWEGTLWVGGRKLRRVDASTGELVQEARRLENIACFSPTLGVCGWKGAQELMAAAVDDLDSLKWEMKGNTFHWAAADDTQLYFLTESRAVETLPANPDAATGWQAFIGRDLSTKLSPAAYALAGPLLYVGTAEPACHAIWTDPAVIRKRWKMTLPRKPVLMSAGSETLFIADDRHVVHAFGGPTRADYEREFAPGDAVHESPELGATLLRKPAGFGIGDIFNPFVGGYRRSDLSRKLRLDYRAHDARFAEALGADWAEVNWPDCCGLCRGPASVRRRVPGAKRDRVPYCEKCDGLVRSRQQAPGVSAKMEERDAREVLRFRNEAYWSLFLAHNHIR